MADSPKKIQNLPAETERIEWAELWPDGQVRPVHLNATPIGSPTKRPPFAHRGTVWVRRTVTYGEWTQFDGDGAGGTMDPGP